MKKKAGSWEKGWKNKFQVHITQKEAEQTMLKSDETGWKTKIIKKDREGQIIMVKYPLLQKEITILNLNVPDKVDSKSIKQKLTKPKQDINNGVIQDFKLLLSVIDVFNMTTTKKNITI